MRTQFIQTFGLGRLGGRGGAPAPAPLYTQFDDTAQAGGAGNNGDIRLAYWRGRTPLDYVGAISDFSGTALDANATFSAPPVGAIAMPATINNPLGLTLSWDGTKAVYDTNPFDAIDFELTDTVNDYYVNYAEGSDANAGTSTGAGNSWKTLDHAVANAVSPAIIHLEDDRIGYFSSGGGEKIFTGKIKFKGEGPSGRTIIAAMRESYDMASFAWASTGPSNAYKSSTFSAKNYRCMFDGNDRNSYGIPAPLTAATSAAECETTAGTFFWDGGAGALTVHMPDGRIPDPADGWLYGEAPYSFEARQGGATASDVMLFENLEFVSNDGALSAFAAFRYRPVTTGSETSARLGLRNCRVYGGHDNGFEIWDADVIVAENCHAWYNRVDGFNYHSFVGTGTQGEYMTVYSHDCTALNNGWDGWADQQPLSTSSNASTSHDSMHVIRTNMTAGECNGAVIADVNGVHSFNVNVAATEPNARGSASPDVLFWHEKYNSFGATRIMYLWGCSDG